jgi:hypothetical protein
MPLRLDTVPTDNLLQICDFLPTFSIKELASTSRSLRCALLHVLQKRKFQEEEEIYEKVLPFVETELFRHTRVNDRGRLEHEAYYPKNHFSVTISTFLHRIRVIGEKDRIKISGPSHLDWVKIAHVLLEKYPGSGIRIQGDGKTKDFGNVTLLRR